MIAPLRDKWLFRLYSVITFQVVALLMATGDMLTQDRNNIEMDNFDFF